MRRVRVIDTHTGGEPTRVVLSGGPDLGPGSMLDRRRCFEQKFDDWRRAIVCEPRGFDAMVGALLTPPQRTDSLCGVIFFNNVGALNMCGHGTIGLAVALAHIGQAKAGRNAIDTPVGQVHFELLDEGHVQIENVPSYRFQSGVSVSLADGRTVKGDVAWGGNWFYLCECAEPAIGLANLDQLTDLASEIRRALAEQGIRGEGSAEIDHIELVGKARESDHADARNFVLCPGGQYDRSPCGTGTSAKVACLAASGKLSPGQIWRQASVIGSRFEAAYRTLSIDSSNGMPREVQVSLTGSAFLTADAELILDSADPFCMGIRAT